VPTVTTVSRRRSYPGSGRLRRSAAGLALVLAGPAVATGIGLAIGLEGRPGAGALFVLAVALVTYAAGFWPGLAAGGLSVVAFEYFFVAPFHEFQFDRSVAVSLGVLVGTTVVLVALMERERRALRALREAERRLELTLEETSTGFWEWDAVEDRFLWSPNLGPIFGLERGARPDSFAELARLVHPDDSVRFAEAQRRILAGEAPARVEFRVVTPAGETRWIRSEATTERDDDGRPIRILGLARDVSLARRREEANRLLSEASELLGRSLEVEETLAGLAAIVAQRLADRCAIELLESEHRPAFFTAAPAGVSKVAAEHLAPRAGRVAATRLAALEAGKTQLLTDAVTLRGLGARSVVVAPIPGPPGPIGVLTLVDAESGRRLDEHDRSLADELARRAGVAVGNAQLHAAERAARAAAQAAADRTARLQRVTAALPEATTPEEVAETLVTLGAPAFEGCAMWVAYRSEDGAALVRAAQVGLPQEVDADSASIPLVQAHTPAVDVARSGDPVWLASAEELASLYPEIGGAYRELGLGPLAAVPIPAAGETTGVILVWRARGEAFSDVDRSFLLALGAQAGSALERVRAQAADAELRQGIERVLDVVPGWQTGSPEEVAGAICRSALETFGASVCHLFDVHGDALRVAWREPAAEDRDPGPEIPLGDFPGLADALVRLRPMFLADVRGGHRHAVRGSEVAPGTQLRSSLFVPVSAAGISDRVLILSWQEVVEDPSPARLAVIRRFADQAALALEQAKRVAAEAEAARSAERVRRLQSVTAELARAVSVQEIAQAILVDVASFGWHAGAVALVREPEQAMDIVEAVGFPREYVDRFRRIPLDARLPVAEAVRTRETVIVATPAERDERFPELRGVGQPSGHPIVAVPLVLGARVAGALDLRLALPGSVDDDDLALLESLGRLAAQAIERARLYEREQAVAATLRRSVLPDIPPRLETALVAARYLPGSAGLDVGGDWYDVITLEGQQVVLAVGDVVGKGVVAASTMAQLRNALRAYALEGFGPAALAGRLNRIAELTDLHFATLFVALVDIRSGECRFTSAGHPPALVVPRDGEAFYVEGGGSLPLGVSTETSYDQGTAVLDPGSTLVLYTDGLVENRTEELATALERLRRIAPDAPGALELLADHLVESMLAGDPRDDVALLAFRLLEESTAGLSLSLPAAQDSLIEARTAVLAWLDVHGCEPELAHEICLACWEACVNAIEHATETRRATIELTGELTRGAVTLTVRDHGGWREPRTLPDRGLGLRLVAELSDALSVKPGLDGTRVSLTRRLPGAVAA
jgi:PAS domain S-box-containing protein